MRMERNKRVLTFLTFILCLLSLVFLTASLATYKWIVSKPFRVGFQSISLKNDTHLVEDTKFKGHIYFGLFHGTKVLNYGFGDRTWPMLIKEEMMQNSDLMSFGIWLFTVLSVGIAILFAIISSIFAIINTVITPIEVVTGIRGLFLWNGFAAFFSASSCISWLIQFQNKLKQNVLTQEEINDGWTSDNRTELGYSYYLVALSMCLFICNIFIIFVAIRRPSLKNKSRTLADKNPEGVIMLY